MSARRAAAAAAAAIGMSASIGACAAVPGRSGALWMVVAACAWDSRVTGSPWPCLHVDHERRFAVVPDPKRRTQVLFTPTVRVSGVEDPQLLAPGAPNDWARAWEMRSWLDRRAGGRLRDADVGLAVNSVPGRTQDQLHIHIDCLRPSMRRIVDADLGAIGATWRELPTPLVRGHLYRARWLDAGALATTDPFRLLAEDPDVAGVMADRTLVMVAASRPSGDRGFVLLSHRADPAARDLGAGEELLDHRCTVLRPQDGDR